MAQLSTYVGVTELTEIIPTEILSSYVAKYNYTPRVGRGICWTKPGAGSIAHSFPRLNAISSVPAGTKDETDAFTDVNVDTTESTITPGIVGLRIPISDEAMKQTTLGAGVSRAVVDAGLEGLADRIDSDILSSITSATNTAGAATDNFTAAKARAAFAAYRALYCANNGAHALVLHNDGLRDLEESHGSNVSPFQAATADASNFGAVAGFKGMYYSGEFALFSSGNAPANASNWAGCLTPIGDFVSGLGLVEVEAPRVEITRGDDAASRAVTFMVVRGWYGVGLSDPNQLLEVLHRT